MCQIIGMSTTANKFKKIKDNGYLSKKIHEILKGKGGDAYSASISFLAEDKVKSKKFKAYLNENGVVFLFDSILNYLSKELVDPDEDIKIILFSRQQPEMEAGSVRAQPYKSKVNNTVFAVHGTIHNDKELSRKLKKNIQADTEILRELDILNWKYAEGAFAVIGVSEDFELFNYQHGMKIWESTIATLDNECLANIVCTSEKINNSLPNMIQKEPKQILMASFSCGMDIGLSVFKEISDGNYSRVILNYFAWGSKAETEEINRLEQFADFYESYFPDIIFETKVIQSKDYFNSYFGINGAPLPKISINSDQTASSQETESPLAYVPYRNTQFAILLASIAEAQNLKDVNFIFGLNLSEGMVFMDNSEGWLSAINETITYGGKDYSYTGTYDIVAPYFTRTKTNMISEFRDEFGLEIIRNILNLSTSCYYPQVDGSICGECGSCILRDLALKNLKI